MRCTKMSAVRRPPRRVPLARLGRTGKTHARNVAVWSCADFPEAKSFCPMRLLKSPQQLKRMSDEFELARSLVRRTAAGGGTARTRSENAPLSTRRPT